MILIKDKNYKQFNIYDIIKINKHIG